MTIRELYEEAYRRARICNNISRELVQAGVVSREPLRPIPIPFHILSAAYASYQNRDSWRLYGDK